MSSVLKIHESPVTRLHRELLERDHKLEALLLEVDRLRGLATALQATVDFVRAERNELKAENAELKRRAK